VVLVGQLELGQKLKLPEMRQVDQRLSVHATLEPLGSDGVAGYVAHRVQVAGGSPDRVRFSADAIEAVYHLSGGVPRLINRICDRALYQGYLRRANEIDVEIVRAAMPGEDVPVPAPPPVAVMPPLRSEVRAVPDFRLPGDSDPVDDWLIEGEKALGMTPILLPGDRVPADRVPVVDRTPAVRMLADQMLADQLAADEVTAERLAAAHIAAERDRLRPSPPPAEVARPQESIRPPARVASERRQVPTVRPEFVPTHMQKTTSKLGRGLGILTLWLMGLTGAGLGGATVWTVLTDLTAPIELPAPPPERPLLMPRALEAPLFSDNLLLDVAAAGDRNGTRIATSR